MVKLSGLTSTINSTGKGALDKKDLRLGPGLYILIGRAAVGKTTFVQDYLPRLLQPMASLTVEDSVFAAAHAAGKARLVSHVGFGEPDVFSLDGADYRGLLYSLSAALTRSPVVVVDSLKMAQISGSGAAGTKGFMRWQYGLLQSWSRMCQLNGVLMIILSHYFEAGKDGADDIRAGLKTEYDATTMGVFELEKFYGKHNAGLPAYEMTAKVRRPIAQGGRNSFKMFFQLD
jgi:hypothetical protein